MNRCDVVIYTDGRIEINGAVIENVTDVTIHQVPRQPTVMMLELEPSSLISGKVPSSTIQDLHADSVGNPDVDIERALRNARLRAAGQPVGGRAQGGPVNPAQGQSPAPMPRKIKDTPQA